MVQLFLNLRYWRQNLVTLLNNIGHLDELNGMKKLSALELEFMQYIWDFPDGVNTMDIYSHFDLARGTMTTIIYRIVNKGYLKKVKKDGLHYVYIYTVSRTDYEKAIMRQQLKEMQRDPSLFRAVAAFCGKEELPEQQKEKVQELLDDIKKDSEE